MEPTMRVALAQTESLDDADRHVAVLGTRQVTLDPDQTEACVGQVEQSGDRFRLSGERLLPE